MSDDDAPFIKTTSSPVQTDREGFGMSPEHISKLVQELEPESITHKIPTLPRGTSPEGNPSHDNSNSSPSVQAVEHLLSESRPSSIDHRPHSAYPSVKDAQGHEDGSGMVEVEIPVNVGGVETQMIEVQSSETHVGDQDSGKSSGINHGEGGGAREKVFQNLDSGEKNSDNDDASAHLPSKMGSLAQLQAAGRPAVGRQVDGYRGRKVEGDAGREAQGAGVWHHHQQHFESGQDVDRAKEEAHALQQVLLLSSILTFFNLDCSLMCSVFCAPQYLPHGFLECLSPQGACMVGPDSAFRPNLASCRTRNRLDGNSFLAEPEC